MHKIKEIYGVPLTSSPAAADTLTAHFRETGFEPKDYDLILTGDLGIVGSDLLCDIMNEAGYDIYGVHNDCGKLIFDEKSRMRMREEAAAAAAQVYFAGIL